MVKLVFVHAHPVLAALWVAVQPRPGDRLLQQATPSIKAVAKPAARAGEEPGYSLEGSSSGSARFPSASTVHRSLMPRISRRSMLRRCSAARARRWVVVLWLYGFAQCPQAYAFRGYAFLLARRCSILTGDECENVAIL